MHFAEKEKNKPYKKFLTKNLLTKSLENTVLTALLKLYLLLLGFVSLDFQEINRWLSEVY